MLDDEHLRLMPSDELREELRAILAARPELARLTGRQPDDPKEPEVVMIGTEGRPGSYPLVAIPAPRWPGRLWVSRMPGTYRPQYLEAELAEIGASGIDLLLSLVPLADYADPYGLPGFSAAARERFGARWRTVEVVDYEAPGDDGLFESALAEVEARLAAGGQILTHCGVGCGRTGMFCACWGPCVSGRSWSCPTRSCCPQTGGPRRTSSACSAGACAPGREAAHVGWFSSSTRSTRCRATASSPSCASSGRASPTAPTPSRGRSCSAACATCGTTRPPAAATPGGSGAPARSTSRSRRPGSVVNAGGHVEREYGVGRGRIDLLVRWRVQVAEAGKAPTQWQQEALELRVWRSGRSDPLAEGLRQLEAYLERLDLQTGVLVVFDRRDEAPPLPERTGFEEAQTPEHDWPVTVLRA